MLQNYLQNRQHYDAFISEHADEVDKLQQDTEFLQFQEQIQQQYYELYSKGIINENGEVAVEIHEMNNYKLERMA